MDSAQGVMTNLHLSITSEHLTSLDCSVLLPIPSGSNAELSLRKLKLPRLHLHECHHENLLQWTSSTSNWKKPDWSVLVDSDKWLVARNFCGKIQDYSKTNRIWRTFDPWVMIRFRSSGGRNRHSQQQIGTNGFFSFKFHHLLPCSNLLLTDHSKTMEFFYWELDPRSPDCTFRVHLPYGYRIQLSATLLTNNGKGTLISHQENGTTTELDNNNAWLIQNGKCWISVQTEDVTGHVIQCLNDRKPSVVVNSLSNVLSFQAVILKGIY